MSSETMTVPVELGDGPEVEVEVSFTLAPPEPAVGYYGWGIEIESIKREGYEIIGSINATELEQISQWIISRISSQWEN